MTHSKTSIDLNDDILKSRVDSVKDYVILSNTRLNYLLQLLELIKEKNRVIMVHQGFYNMVIRDFNRSILLDLRNLVENRRDTHNMQTLMVALKEWSLINKQDSRSEDLNSLVEELHNVLKPPIVKKAIVLASTQAAHKSLKTPTIPQVITYKDIINWLKSAGDILNQISALMWRAGTVMEISESGGDSYAKELRHMERAELAGTHLIRLDEEHEAVNYADRMLKRKSENR
jgi:hypothetical protein